MPLSRRDLLGQIACAFAAAGIGCRIPRYVIDTTPQQFGTGSYGAIPPSTEVFVPQRIWWCASDGFVEWTKQQNPNSWNLK